MSVHPSISKLTPLPYRCSAHPSVVSTFPLPYPLFKRVATPDTPQKKKKGVVSSW